MAGPCRPRKIKGKILAENDTYALPQNSRAGEIILWNPILFESGANVKYFLAYNVQRLDSIDYGDLKVQDDVAKVAKFGITLFTHDFDSSSNFPNSCSFTHDRSSYEQRPKLCSMVYNLSVPLKDIDNIDYKDVEGGKQDYCFPTLELCFI